jgi:hypothetical protein
LILLISLCIFDATLVVKRKISDRAMRLRVKAPVSFRIHPGRFREAAPAGDLGGLPGEPDGLAAPRIEIPIIPIAVTERYVAQSPASHVFNAGEGGPVYEFIPCTSHYGLGVTTKNTQ